ncbi:MAG: sporulation protein YtfJ [Provencibacterium sp.]|nr:sporulation protein YtfJ [Provencibacterium sp.]
MENSKAHPISQLVDSTLDSLRNLVNANAIIGEAISLPDGTTIIPVSKISFGYGTGGSDIPSKNTGEHFGGGGGGGGTIEPIAFISIYQGEVKLMQLTTADSTADRLVNLVPQVFDKVTALVDDAKAKKAAKKAEETAAVPAAGDAGAQ